ncbi:hypothetical protein HNR44_003390 [Geomicrobium halophilum]|uniref:Uncharacterized protein n=1 Tax=Geomicrobium halophilum TaxID=549000 RepID=A0A841Q0Q3_9BACL|nr:hypothetical protein [Geomicrobium halophilum]
MKLKRRSSLSNRSAYGRNELVPQKTEAGLGLEEKKALIDFDSKEVSVKRQCQLLSLSTAYYPTTDYQPDQ